MRVVYEYAHCNISMNSHNERYEPVAMSYESQRNSHGSYCILDLRPTNHNICGKQICDIQERLCQHVILFLNNVLVGLRYNRGLLLGRIKLFLPLQKQSSRTWSPLRFLFNAYRPYFPGCRVAEASRCGITSYLLTR